MAIIPVLFLTDADPETRIGVQVVYWEMWGIPVGQRENDTGKERQLVKGMLISQLHSG